MDDCDICKDLAARYVSAGRTYTEAIRRLWHARRNDDQDLAGLRGMSDAARFGYKTAEDELKRHRRSCVTRGNRRVEAERIKH